MSAAFLLLLWATVTRGNYLDPCATFGDCPGECTSFCDCISGDCINCVAINVGGPCQTVGTCNALGGCDLPPSSAVPTPNPTNAPTVSPGMPTAAPTTRAPTQTPTQIPTSQAPTAAPGSPTVTPTLAPTQTPTSKSPTVAPGSPTTAPTIAPTLAPTAAPTLPVVDVTLTDGADVVIDGNATIGNLTVSSNAANATLVVTGTAILVGNLVITLQAKPPPSETLLVRPIRAAALQGKFQSLLATAADLARGCEVLRANRQQESPNVLTVAVQLVSSCNGLDRGQLIGVVVGCVCAAGVIVLIGVLMARKKRDSWTVATKARLRAQHVDNLQASLRREAGVN